MGESMITSFDGTKLYLKKETAADNKAVIVIVHGLCEHQGRYDYFAEKLHEAGIGTYRFDHRGHGRSEGEETFYSDFNELLDDTNVVVDMAIEEKSGCPGISSWTQHGRIYGFSVRSQISGQKAPGDHYLWCADRR